MDQIHVPLRHLLGGGVAAALWHCGIPEFIAIAIANIIIIIIIIIIITIIIIIVIVIIITNIIIIVIVIIITNIIIIIIIIIGIVTVIVIDIVVTNIINIIIIIITNMIINSVRTSETTARCHVPIGWLDLRSPSPAWAAAGTTERYRFEICLLCQADRVYHT
ncbi:hypothetical protein AK812_SmicGene1104 [Symbiodinium microadriaticum]|uniref:Uncharacterized protein n=1 Tax=Symbiodinium microadriaticum TaxID=2951 RepID=A0A1Q9F502_SYMMI|nr:hypothetical protein AK812_SmicGene1104 [Symbiodinium microadriaticum]